MDTASEKKQHLSFSKKISLLRGYVKSGMSEEDICDTMKITASQFKTMYFYLTQQDKVFYDVPHRAPVRRCKIGENGFSVSLEKIHAIGLAADFPIGWELSFTRDGSKMIIEASEPTQGTAYEDETLKEADEGYAQDAGDEAADVLEGHTKPFPWVPMS